MDLYLFDFDKTLYAYDFRWRLPALAAAAKTSEYRLASRWWAAGHELRAEAGEWPDAEDYLDAFARLTDSTRMSLDQWARARMRASTPNVGTVAALARAASHGAAAVLSNNPSPFAAALPMMAPDVVAIVGDRRLVSAELGVRKPDARIYELALERFGVSADDTFFADDSLDNVTGARALGIHAHHFTDVAGLERAQAAFERRNAGAAA